MKFKSLLILFLCQIAGFASAAESMMQLPPEIRSYYRNPDGSCVQCSIGMCGMNQNDMKSATLLWDTEYGPRVRGGSYPERVAGYCERRGIKAWNITGRDTYDWMRWAAKTGRFAAIGAGAAHFQTLYGYDDRGTADTSDDYWFVCNNNSPKQIDRYSDAAFHRLHEASGPWVVVLDTPPPPAVPQYVKWW